MIRLVYIDNLHSDDEKSQATIKKVGPMKPSEDSSVHISHCPNSAGGNEIPLIIHQSWKTDELPERFQKWKESWEHFHQSPWEHKLWTDFDNMILVNDHYPWFLPTYNNFKMNIMRVDSARYMYMHKVDFN
jgi:mannosyltransferase OCH1-like enzyme